MNDGRNDLDEMIGSPTPRHLLSEPSQPPMLALISRLALDPTVDVDKLEKLLDMQERLEERQAKAEFADALARLQPQLPRIKKDGSIDIPGNAARGRRGGRIRFATWEAIDKELRPLLAAEGFGLSFVIGHRDGGVSVTARLHHRNGYAEECPAEAPLDTGPGRNSLQAYGSTITYLKRYSASALLNIVTEAEDDDGVAGGRTPISAEHAAEIDQLRRELKAPLESFLQLFSVEGIMELSEENYVPAMNLLRARRRRASGEAGP